MARRRAVTSGAPVKVNEEFETPGALWERLEAPGAGDVGRERASTRPCESWNGYATFDQALDMARNGWPEGLKKIAPVVAAVDELIAHAMPEKITAWDVAGDVPDVGAYLAGVPECMLTTEESDGAARMVRIVVNVGAWGHISAETIEARGIIACALVDALERVGYRCEVIAAQMSGGAGAARYGKRVMLKRAEEPLSMDRMAFALIHPAFYRRLFFRLLELQPENVRAQFHGYGSSQAIVGAPGDIVIGELSGSGWTPENCAAEVRRYLEEVGVHMDGAAGDGPPRANLTGRDGTQGPRRAKPEEVTHDAYQFPRGDYEKHETDVISRRRCGREEGPGPGVERPARACFSGDP